MNCWDLVLSFFAKHSNTISIIVSAIVSLVVSHLYFYFTNRQASQRSVILPVIRLLGYTRSKENYQVLNKIISEYEIRFLSHKEYKALETLYQNYGIVSKYDDRAVKSEILLSYFLYGIKKMGINPETVPFMDDDGNIIDFSYPDDIHYLRNAIDKLLGRWDLEDDDVYELLERNAISIYQVNVGTLFRDMAIDTVYKESKITKDWDSKFQKYKNAINEFENLPVIKRTKKHYNIKSVDNIGIR